MTLDRLEAVVPAGFDLILYTSAERFSMRRWTTLMMWVSAT